MLSQPWRTPSAGQIMPTLIPQTIKLRDFNVKAPHNFRSSSIPGLLLKASHITKSIRVPATSQIIVIPTSTMNTGIRSKVSFIMVGQLPGSIIGNLINEICYGLAKGSPLHYLHKEPHQQQQAHKQPH